MNTRADLPARGSDGFRPRGLEMTRLEVFTDAAFAFALTLLVVSLDPPATYAQLIDVLRNVPAFIIGATLLMMFWWGHHQWSRRYGLEDGMTLVLSCLLVFTVLVYVYPLRFMTGSMVSFIGWATGLPVGSETTGVSSVGEVHGMFAVYGIGFTAMSLALALLYVHAWRRRYALGLDEVEQFATRADLGSWLILAAVGALSTLVALLLPDSNPATAGWVYMLLPFVMPLYGRWAARRSPKAEETRVASGAVVAMLMLFVIACGSDGDGLNLPEDPDAEAQARVEEVLDTAISRIEARTAAADSAFVPVPLLTGSQESALRRYGNAEQVARARQLGVAPRDSAHLRELLAAGELVELEDTTSLWIVRELEHSAPYVTPDARALLEGIAHRFHDRLEALGLPAYRLEVTSVLRTPESQADLRRTNPNAAQGLSAHQYATTLDVAYNSFAAPANAGAGVVDEAGPRLERLIRKIAAAMYESTAARRSRELQAVLGDVMIELQSAGDVMVVMERQQPVYHFTVARPQPVPQSAAGAGTGG